MVSQSTRVLRQVESIGLDYYYYYTCQNQTHLIYMVRCLCDANYVGQTTQTMRKRHLGHRAEIRAGADGLGRHFKKHGVGLDLKNEEVFENNNMKFLN